MYVFVVVVLTLNLLLMLALTINLDKSDIKLKELETSIIKEFAEWSMEDSSPEKNYVRGWNSALDTVLIHIHELKEGSKNEKTT